MKHLTLALTLITLASLTEAQTKTGNFSAAISPVSNLKSGISMNGFLSSDNTSKKSYSQQFVNYNEPVNPYRRCQRNSKINEFNGFLGFGNTNIISDVVTLTDKTFVGEMRWQIRGGVRLFENYELNFGVYGRQMPDASIHPELSYNKFLGYSGAIMYEFKIPEASRWGIPFGFEVLKYSLNTSVTEDDGTKKYDNYAAISFGPKFGIRYHASNKFFIELEMEAHYEQFKNDVDWDEKFTLESNTIGSFKFLGLSANRCF